MAKKAIRAIRPSDRPEVTVRYKAAQPRGGGEANSTGDWLAPIRAELPIRVEDLPDLRAQWPGFDFRLTWPEDSPGLVLEVAR